MVLRLVWNVSVVVAVFLYLMNACVVVRWSAVWGLIKVDYLDFTCRLSPSRRCPRRMTPRRMSPRRKAETDIPETGGTDGWRRRMFLGGKAWTHGSFVFMAFRSRDILLWHWSWPSQSRRRMTPRRLSTRRRKAARDGCPRDGGRPPETDVPETEEGRPRRMSTRWISPRRKVFLFKHYVRFERMWLIPSSSFFSWVYGSSDIECLQCCLYVVWAVWWPSGSCDRQIWVLPVQ